MVTEIATLTLVAVVSYLVGSINPAAIIARVRGIDLSAEGSGNPGATNAGRVMGRGTGVLVAVLDILKGYIPVVVADRLVDEPAEVVAGVFAVLGHITSPFLGFAGGKGVATAAGAILGVQPEWMIPVLIAFGITFAITKKMGLASVAGVAILLPVSIIWPDSASQVIFAWILAPIIILRHRQNLAQAWQARRERRSAERGGAGEAASAGGPAGEPPPAQPGRGAGDSTPS